MPSNNKYEAADGLEEAILLFCNDPHTDSGIANLPRLLKMVDDCREDLEDAALGLKDGGLHRVAKIVKDFAKGQPSEIARDICPWAEGSTNAKNWHNSLPMRQQSRRAWRAEKRRRKREGTW